MADNVTANAGAGGATFVTASFDWSGDTAHAAGCFVGILSGAEGTWSFVQLVGGAGAVTAGTQRMTLASDDPAVAKLTTIDVDTGAIATSAASIDGKITACNTGAVVIASGSVAVTNAGTFAVQAAQSGTWNIATLTSITNAVTIQDGGGAITVDGTVAATQSGTWSTRAQDGSGNALTSAARGSERALSVQVVDASGNQVTSFGGSGGGGDGAILDGVTSTVKATVRDYSNAKPIAVSLTDTGGDAIATLPVSLASVPSHAVTNAGTFAVQVTSAPTTAVTGTFWQATQPISAAALPLPAGAATDATLTAIAGYLDTEIASGVGHLSTLAGAVSAGHLQVDVLTAPTTTVSGTVAATQSGTWTVQPGNTANTIAWLVTGTGGTFPITAASLPLPSGAATSALQGGGLPATLGAGGGLKIDGSGTALPVSGTVAVSSVGGSIAVTGTFWQATQPVSLASVPSHEVTNAGTFAVQAAQSGTWTVQPGNTANTTAWLVTGTGGTFPITAASLPLPSGAATSALQGAGLPATLGAGGGLKVDGSGTALPVSGTVTANLGTIADIATQTTLASLNGKVTACNTGAVVLAAGSAIIGSVAIDQTTPGTTNAVVASIAAAQTLASVTTVGTVTTITNVVHVDDNSGSLTVDNAGTFAVQAGQSGTWNITNVSGTVSLPTGAATAAKQPALGTAGTPSADVITVQGIASMTALKVDGSAVTQPVSGTVTANAGTNLNTSALALESGGNLAAIATDAAAIEVLLGTIDADTSGLFGCIGGTELQCDIVGALPAGSNAIGKLAANSGVDIGDVDVTSVVPGTGATSLGKAEDGGHTSGDVGVMALAVRQDAAAALAGTDADYAPLEVDAIGRLHTNNTEVSGYVYDGTTLCTVKRFMAVCSDGDSLIAAVASKKFRILSFGVISLSGTIARFWLDDADAAVVFGSATGFPVEEDSGAAPPGFILPRNLDGWFQTPTANKALRVQYVSGTGACFFGTYIEVA